MPTCIPLKFSMESAWSIQSSEVLSQLSVDPELGLSENEVKLRLQQHGPNSIIVKKKISRWHIFFKQLKNPVVYVLLIAAIIAFTLNEHVDSWAILAIVIINTLIGFVQESKAEKSMEALALISSPKGKVLREGHILIVNSENICPGDILVLEAGDYIVADARIIASRQLTCVESILTGESLPIEKKSEIIKKDSSLAERSNMLYASTALSGGTGKAVVIATGRKTEIGKIAEMMETTESQSTPLQGRLEIVSRNLLIAGIVVIVLVIAIGLAQGRNVLDVLMAAISLSIAAIPEGLPTIVTIALVMAVRRMSKKNALIRKLDAVETLGATDIICTDKTGTLTTGKMQVREYFSWKKDNADDLILTMVLCNNASLDGTGSGDTTEIALLDYAKNAGTDIKSMMQTHDRLFEWSFDSKRKRMSVAVKAHEKTVLHLKGAPESVVTKCRLSAEELKEINTKVLDFSQKGMRVLAFASKEVALKNFDHIGDTEIENDLGFLGLVAMADPPRTETIHSVRKCQASGIRIIMITGDHPETAAAIAYELEIINEPRARVVTGMEMELLSEGELQEISQKVSVYARFSPGNKLKLVHALKAQGKIVAMTGDGVNDAPALKAASIGLAMGKGGTEVARQASSIVLTDDNFATIVDAIEEGRAVNGNIKRTLQYLLSTNAAELLFILGSIAIGWPIPLLPTNLLWLNLVTDGLPSLALAAEKVPEGYLLESTRPSPKDFFDNSFYKEMIFVGVFITLLSFGVYYYGLTQHDHLTARSMAFSFIVFVVLCRSFSCRSDTKTFFEMKLNYYHLFSVLVPLVFQFAMQRFDLFLKVFNIKSLSLGTNFILLALAFVPVTLVEISKVWRRK